MNEDSENSQTTSCEGKGDDVFKDVLEDFLISMLERHFKPPYADYDSFVQDPAEVLGRLPDEYVGRVMKAFITTHHAFGS